MKMENQELYRTDVVNDLFGRNKLTNEIAAERSGLNINTITKIRAGRDVQISTLCSFAKAASIPLYRLFEPKQQEETAK
jgi:transcriptional regulator with XRE-family HTH domain